MMNPAYADVISATDAEGLEVFLATAGRLGTAVEKPEAPRGTSERQSKADGGSENQRAGQAHILPH